MRLNYVFSAGPWLGVCAAGFWYVGCGGSAFGDCADTNSCDAGASADGATNDGSSTDASPEAGPGDAAPPVDAVGSADAGPDSGACDPTLPPSMNPCVVSFEYGVFVATSGADTGDGSKLNPFQTITTALARLGSKRHVFVCGGTYHEHVKITNATDGIGIYGGLDCKQGWTYAGTPDVAFVSPMDEGLALEVDGLATGLLVSDFGLNAVAAASAGGSSIAAFVNQSNNVNFVRVGFKALNGMTGQQGVTSDTYSGGPADQGNPPSATSPAIGGAPRSCSCSDGSMSIGGGGGSGAATATSGAGGMPSINPPMPQPGDDGSGGGAQTPSNGQCTTGALGSNALDGTPGPAPAVSSPGTISATGWVPTGGVGGTMGGTAQGGGGGGGGLMPVVVLDGGNGGAGGGGGGCGGCGGGPGTAGGGGGSSIALMIYSSTAVTLAQCTLAVGNGGDGGSGGNGQPGQAGGAGANGARPGCPGGSGGNGGNGGGGSPGAGGCSIGIAYHGLPMPTLTATTPSGSQAGRAGKAGAGGDAGAPDGISASTMSF